MEYAENVLQATEVEFIIFLSKMFIIQFYLYLSEITIAKALIQEFSVSPAHCHYSVPVYYKYKCVVTAMYLKPRWR